MKAKIVCVWVAVLCLVALVALDGAFAASPAVGVSAGPVLRISPASGAVYTRDSVVVDVMVDDVAGLGAFDVVVLHDPTLLYVQNVMFGDFLGSTGNATTWWTNDYSWASGVQLHAYATGANPAPVGTGVLARIHFVALKAGASGLTFGAAELRDMQDTVLEPLTTVPGTVTITDPEGVLTGKVLYPDDTPAANVRVTASLAGDPRNVLWWALTAADGSFSLPGPAQPPLNCNNSFWVTLDPATVPPGYSWTPMATLPAWCGTGQNFDLLLFSTPPATAPACTVPTVVSPISTTVTCGTVVNLDWAGDCAEYNVEYETWVGEHGSSGWTSWTDFDLVPAYNFRLLTTTMWWHVRGRDATGAETAWSELGLVQIAPEPPLNVHAEATSCDQIAMDWEASSCFLCVDFVAECRAGDGSWGRCRVEDPATACMVGGLNMSTTYSCTVTCVSKSGAASSEAVTATTLGEKTEQEAEDGVVVAPMEIGDDPDASGGQYVSSPLGNEGGVTLKLCVPEAGDYELWGRVRGLGWGADTFWVTVDAGDPVVWEIPHDEWTWAPVTHRDDTGANIVQVYPFDAGGHEIVVGVREAAAQLDLIRLWPAGQPWPGITPSPTPTATPPPTWTPTPTATPSPTWTPTSTPTPPQGLTISGRVYNAALGPLAGVAGAKVSALMCVPRSFDTLSEADGSYSLSLPELYLVQCGSITLEVRAAGYQVLSFAIPVADLRAQPVRDLAIIPLATETPSPVCTPPPCPTGGTLYCPGVCPGGCGLLCATPTATPTPTRRRVYVPVVLKGRAAE